MIDTGRGDTDIRQRERKLDIGREKVNFGRSLYSWYFLIGGTRKRDVDFSPYPKQAA